MPDTVNTLITGIENSKDNIADAIEGKGVTVPSGTKLAGMAALISSISTMSNPMTTAGDIIVGGTDGDPTRLGIGTAGQLLAVNSGATYPEWISASCITELSSQYVRITDLTTGIYKMTYNGNKYIYYSGTSETSTYNVDTGRSPFIFIVNKYSTTGTAARWAWSSIASTSSITDYFIYGGTSSSTGTYSIISISNLTHIVTTGTTQTISGAKTFTGTTIFKTGSSSYGITIPDTSSYTGSNKVFATTDDVTANPGSTTATLTSIKINKTNYAVSCSIDIVDLRS